MRKQAKLAFDMLEQEMECISAEEQRMYKGGTTGDISGSGMYIILVEGGSGYDGSGYYGSGGMGPGDAIQAYIDAHGGPNNWQGGVVPGYGYVGPEITITLSSSGSSGSSGVAEGLYVAGTSLNGVAGVTVSSIDAITKAQEGKWITFSLDLGGDALRTVGEGSAIGDIILQGVQMTSGNLTTSQEWIDGAHIALDIAAIAIGGPVGFVLVLGNTGWEMYDQINQANGN